MKTKKWIAVLLAVVLLMTLLASCGKKTTSSTKENPSTTKVTTTQETKPADPYALTKDDFSYGGRTVNGYTNYIDCIEKSGRTRSYWFSESSEYCRKANRGVDIFDDANTHENKVIAAFGNPNETQESVESPTIGALGTRYSYTFKYHSRTYHKNFYTAYQHGGGEDYIVEIVYTVD